ncbi:tryptophan 2,3-dioxygenase family protein [Silvanigrella aquatica]|uniref:Tryptophan 2,3-dioxygenase n=1 Tax=Silvanigrella aquatica TaxID=1915309 RepID=A0A1L4D1C5_9BACT|nr:tryptophan 2,3-dioxygenase family protein [Silvanigrella aquatica]APJ03997.1 hypothetical protein AXG55_08795 [Silvanigrella aquatica]
MKKNEIVYDDIVNIMVGDGKSDYELYLKTKELLSLQTNYSDLCNIDELHFQLVHQAEELFFKSLNHSLLEVNKYMLEKNTNRILSSFKRAHKAQASLLSTIELLYPMSPREYQDIRLKLGNGSGQDSPGFKSFLKIAPCLWRSYKAEYLDDNTENLHKIYNTEYKHCDAFIIAESFLEVDDYYNKFLYFHMKLIGRSIGLEAHSMKGNVVTNLTARIARSLFPELWDVRSKMTSEWGSQYGIVRDSLSENSRVN